MLLLIGYCLVVGFGGCYECSDVELLVVYVVGDWYVFD